MFANTGTERAVGWTGARPAVTVSENGITVWHSNGPVIQLAVEIDLDPGESMDLPATLMTVRCDTVDEESESFREDLPACEDKEWSWRVLAAGSLIAYSVVFIVIPGVWNNFGAIFVRLGVFAVIYAVIAGIAGIVASVRNNRKADDLEYESQFGEFFTTKKR